MTNLWITESNLKLCIKSETVGKNSYIHKTNDTYERYLGIALTYYFALFG